MHSKEGRPFAFRSSSKKSITCNQALMKDAGSGNIASHNFGISDEIKNVNIKQLLKLMYNTEFSETRLEAIGIGSVNSEELSHKGKTFLEMMDQNTKKVGKSTINLTTEKSSEVPK